MLDVVKRHHGHCLHVGDAVRALRVLGPQGVHLSRKLSKLSSARNAAAHPSAMIVEEVEDLFASLAARRMCDSVGSDDSTATTKETVSENEFFSIITKDGSAQTEPVSICEAKVQTDPTNVCHRNSPKLQMLEASLSCLWETVRHSQEPLLEAVRGVDDSVGAPEDSPPLVAGASVTVLAGPQEGKRGTISSLGHHEDAVAFVDLPGGRYSIPLVSLAPHGKLQVGGVCAARPPRRPSDD